MSRYYGGQIAFDTILARIEIRIGIWETASLSLSMINGKTPIRTSNNPRGTCIWR